MNSCRLPIECEARLFAQGLICDTPTLSGLVEYCIKQVGPRFAAWRFSTGITVPLPDGFNPALAERILASWALSPVTDWSWHQMPAPVVPWREEQLQLLELADHLQPEGIGLLEGSTGLGKTRAFSFLGHKAALQSKVIIAVPTLAIGRQWQLNWSMFSSEPLAEVWGKSHYGDDELAGDRQAAALVSAGASSAILCTHQMVPKVLDATNGAGLLLIDEGHLFSTSLAGSAGSFFPIAAMGSWLQRWCEHNALPGTEDYELELAGRMLEIVVKRTIPELEQNLDWRASILYQADKEPLVWLRHSRSTDSVLDSIWGRTRKAVVFSGTLSTLLACGIRSVHQLARRLGIPQDRLQDLGRVRPNWRDAGVTVLLPPRYAGSDSRPWLGAYRGREEIWWPEAAQAILALRKRPGRSLVLATSYKDIEGIRLAMGRTAGIVVSEKNQPVEVALKALAKKSSWCWLATGVAWTGMDTTVPLQRVVILKLPLPDPTAMRLLAHPEDAVFDAVSRFRQGVGRLVRASDGHRLEVIVLDGRVNDPSPRWRSICQPFLQVLGEDFEEHGTLEVAP